MGQLWQVNTLGGYMYADELSDVLRTELQPLQRFRQFCDADDASEKGLNAGDLYNWNVYSDVETQGGVIAETQTMPQTRFTVAQNFLRIVEWGNSVPFTGKLDDLSRHPVEQIVRKALKNDAKKAFEAAAHAQFALTPLKVVPASGNSATAIELTTNGTPAQTNNIAMRSAHVKLIVDEMKERDIPSFDGSNYGCVGRPSTFRAFKNDLEAVHSYVNDGFQMILHGEIGRSYEGVRFFEQTAIAKRGWTNNLSDQAFFFGEDTVMEALVIPEEIRGKIPGDFGRDRGVAWYAMGGFGLVHTDATQARIVEWASAA